MKRRDLLTTAGALATTGMVGCAAPAAMPARAQVVVIGGGFGGATAARYVRLLSQQRIDVVMIEPQPRFVSCPGSNLVLGGTRTLAELTLSYDALTARHGVRWVRDEAAAIDAGRKQVTLASGEAIGYDKLVLSPGIELMFDEVEGLRRAHDDGRVLQAWKAGPETLALRRQLEAMPDGGVFAITIPESPYRCPPGPYERACVVAAYLRRAKPRSKLLILDANADVVSKPALFKAAWRDLYPGIVEYRPQHKVIGVDAAAGTLRIELQDAVRADVLNVLPPMRAGALAVQSGLANAVNRWCRVNFIDFASTVAQDVHVLGDAIQIAPGMPKSAHMANAHAKVAAAAIVAQLSGVAVNDHPMLTNTCYSFVDETNAIHVASVHEYVAAESTFKPVAGAGGVSAQRNEAEGAYAGAWARNIWADTLGT